MNTSTRPGLTVIYGPMKSGKTTRLIEGGGASAVFFVASTTNKNGPTVISGRGSSSVDARWIASHAPSGVFYGMSGRLGVKVCIDEAQFFSVGIISTVDALVSVGLRVIVAGLDLDFCGEPFGFMSQLIEHADIQIPLTANCDIPSCEEKAEYTQRLIHGLPAPYDSPQIDLGSATDVDYEARCKKHFVRVNE